MKNVNYNVRIDPEIKSKAEETFAMFGLNLSEAITVFLHKSIRHNGFPFEVREPVPNARLLAAMEETEQILKEYEDGTRERPTYTTVREMFAAMDAEDEAEGIL